MEVDRALFLLNCLSSKHNALKKFHLSFGNNLVGRDHAEVCEAIKTVTQLIEQAKKT